jgi:hypothetical protein
MRILLFLAKCFALDQENITGRYSKSIVLWDNMERCACFERFEVSGDKF